MKGFLRRTLESARGAEQRLKPLTGSVYAGNRRRQEFQAGSWGEETDNIQLGVPPAPSAAPQSRQHSQPGISQAAPTFSQETLLPITPVPREEATGDRTNISDRPRPSSAFVSPVDASAAPPVRESVTHSASSSSVSHSGALPAPLPLLPPLRPDNLPLFSGSPRDEGFRAEVAVPQVPQEISRTEKIRPDEKPRRAASSLPQKVEPLLRPAMAAKPPSAGPQLSLLRSRPPQEPEIQVHIGRIEVIAAAPQPPRVPSPRPNRATSLADYLAGRNGRA